MARAAATGGWPTRADIRVDGGRGSRLVSSPLYAPVAQLDRVLPSEEVKRRFEAGGFN